MFPRFAMDFTQQELSLGVDGPEEVRGGVGEAVEPAQGFGVEEGGGGGGEGAAEFMFFGDYE